MTRRRSSTYPLRSTQAHQHLHLVAIRRSLPTRMLDSQFLTTFRRHLVSPSMDMTNHLCLPAAPSNTLSRMAASLKSSLVLFLVLATFSMKPSVNNICIARSLGPRDLQHPLAWVTSTSTGRLPSVDDDPLEARGHDGAEPLEGDRVRTSLQCSGLTSCPWSIILSALTYQHGPKVVLLLRHARCGP